MLSLLGCFPLETRCLLVIYHSLLFLSWRDLSLLVCWRSWSCGCQLGALYSVAVCRLLSGKAWSEGVAVEQFLPSTPGAQKPAQEVLCDSISLLLYCRQSSWGHQEFQSTVPFVDVAFDVPARAEFWRDDPSQAKSIGHQENTPRIFSLDVLPASFFGIRFELFHYGNSNQSGWKEWWIGNKR